MAPSAAGYGSSKLHRDLKTYEKRFDSSALELYAQTEEISRLRSSLKHQERNANNNAEARARFEKDKKALLRMEREKEDIQQELEELRIRVDELRRIIGVTFEAP